MNSFGYCQCIYVSFSHSVFCTHKLHSEYYRFQCFCLGLKLVRISIRKFSSCGYPKTQNYTLLWTYCIMHIFLGGTEVRLYSPYRYIRHWSFPCTGHPKGLVGRCVIFSKDSRKSPSVAHTMG